jgi:hypothetical protein
LRASWRKKLPWPANPVLAPASLKTQSRRGSEAFDGAVISRNAYLERWTGDFHRRPIQVPVEVVLDTETRGGFEVRYDTGEVAEVSWAFIRELPPRPVRKQK